VKIERLMQHPGDDAGFSATLLKEKSEIHDGSKAITGYRRGLFWTWKRRFARSILAFRTGPNTYTQSFSAAKVRILLKRFSCLLGDSQSDITTRAVFSMQMHLNGGLDNWVVQLEKLSHKTHSSR